MCVPPELGSFGSNPCNPCQSWLRVLPRWLKNLGSSQGFSWERLFLPGYSVFIAPKKPWDSPKKKNILGSTLSLDTSIFNSIAPKNPKKYDIYPYYFFIRFLLSRPPIKPRPACGLLASSCRPYNVFCRLQWVQI